MAIAAYTKAVQVKTTGSTTYIALPGTSFNLNLGGDVLDDTDFTSTGYRSRIIGLRDWSVSGSANYDTSNTGITTLRSAWLNRTRLDVKYLPNGTAGYTGQVQVESFDLSGDIGSLETVDISLQADGSLTTA